MAENDQPPAPPVGSQSSVKSAPAAKAEEMLPTVRDHVERLKLEPWQAGAIVARLHGAHDEKGNRVFVDGVSMTTRMSDEDFDEAADVALHGRV